MYASMYLNVRALQGQRAHSPGHSAATPRVSCSIIPFALKGQKH